MKSAPPRLPRKGTRKTVWIVVFVIAALFVLGGAYGVYAALKAGVTAVPDTVFGDQHLKTSVALIELHKVRTGSYPEKLQDIEFVGEWDRGALQRVDYIPAEDRQSYYVEVRRGWVGKPELRIPEGFWTGTGFDESLGNQPNKAQ
jgi:hypothetical protein